MKPLFLLLLIAGFLLGPGYWLYARLFGGNLLKSVELTALEEGFVAEALIPEPGVPEINLILRAKGSFRPNMDPDKPPSNRYRVSLWQDGELLQEAPLQLETPAVPVSEPVFRAHLMYWKPGAGGEYRLRIEPLVKPEMALSQVVLELRTATDAGPSANLVLVGAVAMALGLAGLLFAP